MIAADNNRQFDRSTRWLERLMFAALLLACAVALSKNQADPDIWGHVQYGRDALREGLPSTATYSYTAAGRPWINHEIVSEYLLAIGVDTVGPAGLVTVKCLLGVLLLFSFARHAFRRGVPRAAVYTTLMLVACSLMHFWSLRPQLLTYVFFALMMAHLDWCFRDESRTVNPPASERRKMDRGRLRWLWALPPLFAIWANSHGGFLAGYGVLAVYFVGRSLQALWAKGRGAVGPIVLLAGVLATSGLATLLNPYGVELHRWLLQSLAYARPEIVEWRPPELFSIVWPAWWLLVALFIASVLGTRRPRDPVQFLLLALTLWQACAHRRHIPFFAILFGYWMPVHVASSFARWQRRAAISGDGQQPAARSAWGMVAVLVVACGLMGYSLLDQLRQMPVRVDGYPVTAFQYMADHQLHGRLVVRFKWAQYAIAAFGTPSPGGRTTQVVFDGRFRTCYPQEIVDLYFDFADGDLGPKWRHRSPDSPPVDGSRILEYGNPDLVLVDRGQPHPMEIMRRHRDGWTLLYQDSLAQLWGRAEIYDDPQHPSYLPPDQRLIGDEPQQGVVAWPALPRHPGSSTQLAQRESP